MKLEEKEASGQENTANVADTQKAAPIPYDFMNITDDTTETTIIDVERNTSMISGLIDRPNTSSLLTATLPIPAMPICTEVPSQKADNEKTIVSPDVFHLIELVSSSQQETMEKPRSFFEKMDKNYYRWDETDSKVESPKAWTLWSIIDNNSPGSVSLKKDIQAPYSQQHTTSQLPQKKFQKSQKHIQQPLATEVNAYLEQNYKATLDSLNNNVVLLTDMLGYGLKAPISSIQSNVFELKEEFITMKLLLLGLSITHIGLFFAFVFLSANGYF